ncbi:MAG TPA: hypothetical protein VMG31_01795 [Verrucomicrobiae bacterium]|nr:hypothetical protein [Verrucomicrobiae bacterium]
MDDNQKPVKWPEGKQFAFTIFDDPDGQTLTTSRIVYDFLSDLGFHTTIAVWPLGASGEPNSGGETCANPEYLNHLRRLAAHGFEIAWHNAAPHTSTRHETALALERFRDYFGHDPTSMANHYNGEALYWGPDRVTGIRRSAYLLLTRYKSVNRYFGHVEGHPYFWGDLCHGRIPYCRNFVFSGLNTLRFCPWMPYRDLRRPWVRSWFAASDGATGPAFLNALSEANQDCLEEEGGASIVYTHFGHGFVREGKLESSFVRLMRRLRKKNGWFVPAHSMLDHLAAERGVFTLDDRTRRAIEWRWLAEKTFRGTS